LELYNTPSGEGCQDEPIASCPLQAYGLLFGRKNCIILAKLRET